MMRSCGDVPPSGKSGSCMAGQCTSDRKKLGSYLKQRVTKPDGSESPVTLSVCSRSEPVVTLGSGSWISFGRFKTYFATSRSVPSGF